MVESPLLWFNVLKGTLTKLGFQQSEEDKCLFFHPERNIIILTYVDDCLFFGRDKASVDNLIEEIKTIHSLKVLNPERSAFVMLLDSDQSKHHASS